MTKYREILRLTALGLSQRNIVQSIGVSQKTVVKVQKRAWEMHLSWPLDESLTDSALETLMFHKESKVSADSHLWRPSGPYYPARPGHLRPLTVMPRKALYMSST